MKIAPKTKVPPNRWAIVRKRYRERGLVLVLGAGISTGCRVPDWSELIRRMADDCLGKGGRDKVNNLIKEGYSLPSIAGILDSKRNNRALLRLTSEALYRDFPFTEVADTNRKRHRLIRFVKEHNSSLRAVAAFCARKNPSVSEYGPNPLVAAVVNFNLDSILRSYSRARFRSWLFRTIERADRAAGSGRIPIYHMHGLISFYAANNPNNEELPCVLTEQQYFDFFNRPNSVFNYTFLYLLREYNCLFVGMSMRDDNIRRLLHYSASERREAAIAKSATDGKPPRTALRHFAILKRSSPERDSLIEISLRRLGTRVLWVHDYWCDIPERLEFVYNQPGIRWTDVY